MAKWSTLLMRGIMTVVRGRVGGNYGINGDVLEAT